MKVSLALTVICLISICSLLYFSGFLQKTFSQGEVATNMTAFMEVEPESNSTLSNSTLSNSTLSNSTLSNSTLSNSSVVS